MKKILILIPVIFLIYSCGEDSATEPNPKGDDLLMTEIDSYWVYNIEQDTSNGFYDAGIDSVVLEEITEDRDGRKSYDCFSYQDTTYSGEYYELGLTNIYAKETDRLYMHKDVILPNLPDNVPINPFDFFELEEDWYKIADNNEDNWQVIDQEIEFNFGNINVKGDLTGNVHRVTGDRILDINNEELRLKGFKSTITFDGTINNQFPLKFSIISTLWVSEGVGPVVLEREATTINLFIQTIDIPASKRTLLRYKRGG